MLPNRKQAFGGGTNILGGSGKRNNVYSDDINWYKALNAGGVKRPNTRPTKEELKKERIKAEVKFEIDRTPVENMNYANVPPELLESVKAFVINQGRDHGKKGMIQKQMHESDLNRIDMKVEKDMIADSIPQLNSQFLELKQMRQEWAENNETDAVSDMVDPDAIEKINNALNNKMQMSYNAQGNIIFGEGDDAFELSSLPKYFNKDFASSKDIAKKNSQVFKNGVILSEQQQLMYENDFNEMLGKGGDETLLSLAFDKGLLGGPSHSYLNVDNYQDQLDAINGDDPTAAYEARAQIREDLTSKYMTALTQQAKDGFEAKKVLNNNNDNGDDDLGVRGRAQKLAWEEIDWTKSETAYIDGDATSGAIIDGHGTNVLEARPLGNGKFAIWYKEEGSSETNKGTQPNKYVDREYTKEEIKRKLGY